MARFVARSALEAPADRLYAWHMCPGAFERLAPPWERIEVLERAPRLEEGARVVLRLGRRPLRVRWAARHEGFVPGRQFRDVQQAGPMAHWTHTHRFVPRDGGSMLEDAIDYRLPLGAPGRWLGERAVERRLRRTFTYRHRVTRADLERHARTGHGPALHVAVSGSSGLVGSALVAFLGAGGHRISRLVRRTPRVDADEILFDPAAGRLDARKLADVDAVVHLAGENIAGGRWTRERKRRIVDSRVAGTRLIAQTLAGLERRPRVLVSASAVGYYGDRGDEPLDESSPPGEGFLAETCRQWESATAAAAEAGMRVVLPRIGVVLAAAGGALARMRTPFRLGLGGRVGDGRQYMSWIALDDLIGVLHHALFRADLVGPVNAVAPAAARNATFAATLGRVLRRPAVLPFPAAAVRLLLGELGQELLLAGARVEPRRLLETGFAFRHPVLEDALRFELGRFARDADAPEFEIGAAPAEAGRG